MGLTSGMFGVAGPLIGNSGVQIYENVQSVEAGGPVTTQPLTYNPFAEIFSAGEAGVEALPAVVTETIDLGVAVVDDVVTVVEDVAHAVDRIVKDGVHGLEWILEHPALVIVGAVAAVAIIAYASSSKTSVQVSK